MRRAPAGERVLLREATAADIGFILATERLPGYELLTARWTDAEHRAAMARDDTRYLVGSRSGDELEGFAIMQPLADPHEGAKLKRICVTRPGAGFGQPFLAAIIDWVFAHTHNERARHVYRRLGMRDDGLLRQAYRMPDGSRADRSIMSILRSERPAQ